MCGFLFWRAISWLTESVASPVDPFLVTLDSLFLALMTLFLLFLVYLLVMKFLKKDDKFYYNNRMECFTNHVKKLFTPMPRTCLPSPSPSPVEEMELELLQEGVWDGIKRNAYSTWKNLTTSGMLDARCSWIHCVGRCG